MRDPRLIHLWGPLFCCCEGKNGKCQSICENRKITLWKHGLKKFSIITEVPTITAFVAAFEAKALNCTELLESYQAGGNRIINCYRQTNRNRHNWNIWQNIWSTFFIRITSVFLICVKKKQKNKTNTLHAYSKTLKHNVETTLQLAYHGCKNLTRTSKIRHVKRTHMVGTVRFKIR